MASHKPLNEQVMVITGASSGIGLTTALHAARQGARLVLIARSAETLKALAGRIASDGGEALHVVADVADRKKMEEAAQEAVRRFGRIDTWVNNAGVSIYGRLDKVSETDSRRLFDVNFWGVVNGSLAALPHLKRSGGALINLGSEVSESVAPFIGMYAASKHAVKGFTDALRVEIEEMDAEPVSITLIQPTAVNTPFPHHAKNYMDREPKLPPPVIEPDEVAEAILKAATSGGRDVKVGAMAVVNTAVSTMLPTLGDKMSVKRGMSQMDDVPPVHPEGTLFQSGEEGRGRDQGPAHAS
jgi:short-subunit dehydrogenase